MMTFAHRLTLIAVSGLAGTLLWGCADEAIEPGPAEPTPNECLTGTKCDGLSDKFKDYYDDMRDLSLSDLTILGAGLATDEINDALGVPYTTIELEPTSLYGHPDQAFGIDLVNDIDELDAGLTSGLGEHSFATDINRMRKEVVDADPEVVYAESAFTLGVGFDPSWSIDAGDAVGTVGFKSGVDMDAVVIAPYNSRLDGIKDNPLQTIKDIRGFVLPRDMNDIRAMQPGESLAMQAQGVLGLNLGVGVPFYLGTLVNYVTVHIRLHLGARVSLEGDLDVQLIRGRGDDAYVDVGLSSSRVRNFSVALSTGYGIAGLPEVEFDIGFNVDVTNIAEKALSKQINNRLGASLSASSNKKATRLTVARFKVNVETGSHDVEQAVNQALRGDIRLAQALGNRPGSGVEQVLDLTKDKFTESNYLGFRWLGMEFYRQHAFSTGSIQIEADGENQTILFSDLEDSGGLFFQSESARWRKVVSILRRDGEVTDAQVNTRLTLTERDRWLSRDQMLDNVDPMLGYMVGFDPLFLGPSHVCDDLAAYYDHHCGPQPHNQGDDTTEQDQWEACIAGLPGNPEAVALETEARNQWDVARNNARAGFDPELVSGLDVADQLFDMKLALSAQRIKSPKGAMVSQVRFSNDALNKMFVLGGGQRFRQTLEDVFKLRAADRDEPLADKKDELDDDLKSRTGRMDELAEVFNEAALTYRRYDEVAKSVVAGQTIGPASSLILVREGRNNSEPEIDLASIVEHQGQVLEELYPELVNLADDGILHDLDHSEAFVVGYALMWLSDPASVEMLLNFSFDEDEDFQGVQIYTRGKDATFIDAGRFNLDELLESD